MGAYLSKPSTDKSFETAETENIKFSAGRMQGWRTSQEDAHVGIMDFTQNMSIFAVFDGHGGAEVAQMCMKELPDYVKENKDFKEGNYTEALINSFLEFDALLLTKEKQEELKVIANLDEERSTSDDDEEDPNLLQREAILPLEEILKQYKQGIMENGGLIDSKSEDISEEIKKEGCNSSGLTALQNCIKGKDFTGDDGDEDDEEEDSEEYVGEDEEEEEECDSEECEDGDGSSDDEEDEEDDEDSSESGFGGIGSYMNTAPGFDSGTTAVVALLNWEEKKIYVANAGDSRCVLCRNSEAVELSFDHKPEDDIEIKRITAAGGRLSDDGRVNGGLNLSRAIGDHSYKQNAQLDLKDQMISSLPDIKVMDLKATDDEFMVLACDGIWNSFTSQALIDFIRELIDKMTLEEVISNIFDHCLAPNTAGDGTGCDNMTCIIVKFKYPLSSSDNHTSAANTNGVANTTTTTSPDTNQSPVKQQINSRKRSLNNSQDADNNNGDIANEDASEDTNAPPAKTRKTSA